MAACTVRPSIIHSPPTTALHEPPHLHITPTGTSLVFLKVGGVGGWMEGIIVRGQTK